MDDRGGNRLLSWSFMILYYMARSVMHLDCLHEMVQIVEILIYFCCKILHVYIRFLVCSCLLFIAP
jgi:hypothetical protein